MYLQQIRTGNWPRTLDFSLNGEFLLIADDGAILVYKRGSCSILTDLDDWG